MKMYRVALSRSIHDIVNDGFVLEDQEPGTRFDLSIVVISETPDWIKWHVVTSKPHYVATAEEGAEIFERYKQTLFKHGKVATGVKHDQRKQHSNGFQKQRRQSKPCCVRANRTNRKFADRNSQISVTAHNR